MSGSRDAFLLAVSREVGEERKPTDTKLNVAVASAAFKTGFPLNGDNAGDVVEEARLFLRRKK